MRVASYHLIVWKCKQETHTLCVGKGLDWNPAAALSRDQGQACVSLLKTSVFLCENGQILRIKSYLYSYL